MHQAAFSKYLRVEMYIVPIEETHSFTSKWIASSAFARILDSHSHHQCGER